MTSWSYSSLSKYEQCPRSYFYTKIEGLRSPPGAAAQRGIKAHEQAEKYLRGERDDVPVNFSKFRTEMENLRQACAEAEREFSFTQEWDPTDWDASDMWVRGKVDAILPDQSVVIDFKTGRYYPGHRDQASLYALFGFVSGAVGGEVSMEFWYLDLDDVTTWTYHERDVEALRDAWEKRVEPLMLDTTFDPKPGKHCKWCPANTLCDKAQI